MFATGRSLRKDLFRKDFKVCSFRILPLFLRHAQERKQTWAIRNVMSIHNLCTLWNFLLQQLVSAILLQLINLYYKAWCLLENMLCLYDSSWIQPLAVSLEIGIICAIICIATTQPQEHIYVSANRFKYIISFAKVRYS